MASFFQDIPPDLEAAAMVDGCSRVGALFRVVIPLSAPGVFTAAILAFVNAWDEFLLALTLMNRVNQIYNDDLAIRLVLVDGSDKLNLDTVEKVLARSSDHEPGRFILWARREVETPWERKRSP